MTNIPSAEDETAERETTLGIFLVLRERVRVNRRKSEIDLLLCSAQKVNYRLVHQPLPPSMAEKDATARLRRAVKGIHISVYRLQIPF